MIRLFAGFLAVVAAAPFGSLGSAQAQLLVVTAGESETVSRTLRVDTSMAVSGAGITVPGAINAAAPVPLNAVSEATLRARFADGSSLRITAGLEDFADHLPAQVMRNQAGDGLLKASSTPAAPSGIMVSTGVPAITALGMGQSVFGGITLQLGLLSVFP